MFWEVSQLIPWLFVQSKYECLLKKSPRTLEKQEFKAEADSGKNKASRAETYGKLSVQQYQLIERELKPDKIFLTTIKPGIK